MPKFDKEYMVGSLKMGVRKVKFTKVDGTERVMRCTLSQDYLPPRSTKVKADDGRAKDPNIISAWDVEKKAWRSFFAESVSEFDIEIIGPRPRSP